VVFHLIDGRLTELSDTDISTIQLVSKASRARTASNLEPFLYSILITKVDKSNARDIAAVERSIKNALNYPNTSGDSDISVSVSPDTPTLPAVQILPTSSVTKKGRDTVWALLGDTVFSRRSKKRESLPSLDRLV
jgi:hypothetical protein